MLPRDPEIARDFRYRTYCTSPTHFHLLEDSAAADSLLPKNGDPPSLLKNRDRHDFSAP